MTRYTGFGFRIAAADATIRLWWVLGVGLLPMLLSAQTTKPFVFRDSILTVETFFEWVKTNHPVARQASMQVAIANAENRVARGAFDPKIYLDQEAKKFSEKQYFNLGEAGLKIPIPIGAEVKGAYGWANGQFLNPENTLPERGQVSLGIQANLGQGLLIDERRANIQKARLELEMAEAGQRLAINDLLLAANEVYWNWAYATQVVMLLETTLQQAIERKNATIEIFQNGYKPAIDTLEADILVSTLLADLELAKAEQLNTLQALSAYLWLDEDTPFSNLNILYPNLRRGGLKPETETPLWQSFTPSGTHPLLLIYAAKANQLEWDRRLKQDKLKPKISAEYYLLGQGWQLMQTNDGTTGSLAGYKWGIQASFPLFLRQERGNLAIANLKIQDNQATFDQKQLDISTKLNSYQNSLLALYKQLQNYQSIVGQYYQLLEAENSKFLIGESSIFLVNARTQKWLESRVKLAKIENTYQKTGIAIRGVAGELGR